MTINSINTNIAAYFAQQNIGTASSLTSLSVARLSSGNRIIRAADDVAALAIGTSLSIQVSVFKTALLNAASGTSLLQVADGSLSQITDIVKRQKTIAAQAGSGSLSDTERAYLDKEFQSLADEIDRIATTTTFSGVHLIDGSISGATSFSTNTADSDATAKADDIFTITASLPTAGDTITVAGITFTFTTADPGSSDFVGNKIAVGATATATAQNIAAVLNKTAATDGRLANLYFNNSAGVVSANWTGGDGAGSVTVAVSSSFTCSANTDADASINIASSTNGLGIHRTSIVGSVTGTIFVDSGTTAQQAGQAINLANVEDNADFVGAFGKGKVGLITGSNTATDTATFSLKVGDVTYRTAATDLTNAGAVTTLTFTGFDQYGTAKGGSFTISLNGSNVATFDSQSELDPIVQQLNDGLKNLKIVQNRDVLLASGAPGHVTSGGVDVANLTDFQFDYRTDSFSKLDVSSLKITAPGAGATDAVFEVVINGEIYRSIAGIGNQIGLNTVIALQNVNDSSKQFTITTGNGGLVDATSTSLDLGTQAKADVIADALSDMLGIGANGTGLQFQVGANATDQLNVTIGDATTASLYNGESLSVATQDDAAAAALILDAAVTAITNLRAGVGALQSRFAFASANIQTVVQNQDAARAELLDTDIASESTSYANNQVKLQAGIAVLAQANQQTQSLLKLIG